MGFAEYLRKRVTDYTPGVGRVFVACKECQRVVAYYRLYGPRSKASYGCPHCGHTYFKPVVIAEWQAALRLAWGWLTRQGDPRMPLRVFTGTDGA